MDLIDRLVGNAGEWAEDFTAGKLAGQPSLHLAVVACQDSRLDPQSLLGLGPGEAHYMRNAGGTVTDDMIRSLCISQRFLGTREIVLIHHTNCGVHGLDEAEFKRQLEDETGVKPAWSFESFDDPYDDVRQSIERLRANPFLKSRDAIAGFVYDVDSGKLIPVEPRD